MRSLIVGLGVQGKKRASVAGTGCVGTVDPYCATATFRDVRDVPLSSYDAALVCTPDDVKLKLLRYLLDNGKHVLVEKPLVTNDIKELEELRGIADRRSLALYTAYNHRFEPHIAQLKQIIDSGKLGRLYHCRIFYGNGTARLVRESMWRDQGTGVLGDIGSHLLDTICFLFGSQIQNWERFSFDRFENRSFDRIAFGTPHGYSERPAIQLEATMLSWKNTFSLDLFGEKGSAHIECLCKWGPSTLRLRNRILPSGRPTEEAQTLEMPDPTWELEYRYFVNLCKTGGNNIDNDIWILKTIQSLNGGHL